MTAALAFLAGVAVGAVLVHRRAVGNEQRMYDAGVDDGIRVAKQRRTPAQNVTPHPARRNWN